MRAYEPQMLILSSALADADGISLCEKIRSNPSTQHIAIVMIVENMDVDTLVRVFLAGADDLLGATMLAKGSEFLNF